MFIGIFTHMKSTVYVDSQHDLVELKRSIEDFLDSLSKTNRLIFIRRYWYINCSADTAAEEMAATQLRFGKTGGNVAYHAYQSFKTGEVSAEECHRIGVETAYRLWGTDHQVLVATHFNTGTYPKGVLAEQGTASRRQKDTAESVQMVQNHGTENTCSAGVLRRCD